jgi:hypothetical protein
MGVVILKFYKNPSLGCFRRPNSYNLFILRVFLPETSSPHWNP